MAKKDKPGRPKSWVPSYESLQEIELMAGNGLTEGQIADAIGIHQDTFINRKHEYPEIAEHIKSGRAKALNHVSNALYEAAVSGQSIAATIFYLKCRGQGAWKETQVTELVGADGQPIKMETKSEVAITGDLVKSRIDEIMAKQ